MRAIKIDPAAKTITEIELKRPNQSLQEFYDIIGCDLVQLIELDRGIILVCDEEAKLKPITGAFTFYDIKVVPPSLQIRFCFSQNCHQKRL
ncbi:MAG: hypothetical protein PHI85_06905 [Victivallaceae bacterium]|nr:hypothetical protein [Victivallaceae bacterium]